MNYTSCIIKLTAMAVSVVIGGFFLDFAFEGSHHVMAAIELLF